MLPRNRRDVHALAATVLAFLAVEDRSVIPSLYRLVQDMLIGNLVGRELADSVLSAHLAHPLGGRRPN
jgi:hypothetical protein